VGKIKNGLKKFFYIIDGGKERINFKKILSILGAIFASSYLVMAFVGSSKDASYSRKSDKSIISSKQSATTVLNKNNGQSNTFHISQDTGSANQDRSERSTKLVGNHFQYRAKQVIARDNNSLKKNHLPTGANVIGKLLNAVDTRNLSSMIKVLLPYGAKFQGEEFLSVDTMLIGKANVTGKSERVELTFDKAITPDGHERVINAYALDTSDYASGVIGEVHSERGVRIAGTLGLTMISGMTDVLTEKTSQGELGIVTAKSSVKNGIYHGVSKVSEMEAARQAEEISQTQPYITLDAGRDIIITLKTALEVNDDN